MNRDNQLPKLTAYQVGSLPQDNLRFVEVFDQFFVATKNGPCFGYSETLDEWTRSRNIDFPVLGIAPLRFFQYFDASKYGQ